MSRLAGLAAVLLVLAADQASKAWVLYGLKLPQLGSVRLLPVLNLTWVENRGITFGLLNGGDRLAPVLLTLVALAVVAALAVWLWRSQRALVAAALGAVAGGALGNVVDFIHAHAWGWSWYVFNVADAAIVCGVGALVLDGMLTRKPAPDPPQPDRLARARDGG